MKAIVPGAAAGSGFPLRNSNAEVCRRARADDPHAVPRTQAMASFALRFWLRSKWIATSIIMSRKCPSAVDKRHSMCTAKLHHRIRRERAAGTEEKTPASVGRRRWGRRLIGGRRERTTSRNKTRVRCRRSRSSSVSARLRGRCAAMPGSFSHLPARTLMRRHWCGVFSYSSVWHRGIR
jgi:hypothetical protein